VANNAFQIDLLSYKDHLQTKKEEGKTFLFDQVRKKWLVLQPEEMVRQLMIYYLIEEKNYNPNRFSLEKGVKVVNKLARRFDLLIYDLDMKPFLILECKAPQIKLKEATFSQIHAYNYDLKVPYAAVTNGIHTFCYRINWETEDRVFLDGLPEYTG